MTDSARTYLRKDVMKVGITTFVSEGGMAPDVLAREIEARGFESLFLPEHSHTPVCRATPYPFGEPLPAPYYCVWDPFVALAAAAVATESLLLGTSVVLLAQRDPIQTAKEVACLDQLSMGRFIFGVGAGWNREEMRNHDVVPETRGALLDEKIRAMREIWTHDEAEFHGKYIAFDAIFQWPKPMQLPSPPIYVGGTGNVAVMRAKRLGVGWMPLGVNHVRDVNDQVMLMRQGGNSSSPITVTMVRRDQAILTAYHDAGVERVSLFLPPKGESESLRRLDELARTIAKAGFLAK